MNKKRIFALLLTLVLTISALPLQAFAKGDVVHGMAWITGNRLRLRASASTSAKTLDYAAKGDVAVVISKQGKWYKVIYNNQTGYMHRDYLNVLTKENVELGYGRVNANKVNMRSGASTSKKVLTQSNKGDMAYIIGVNTGWYKVIFNSQVCYIRSDYLDLTEIPYENADSSKSPVFFRNGKTTGVKVSADALKDTNGSVETVKPEEKPEEKPVEQPVEKPAEPEQVQPNTIGDQIVAKAKTCMGVPYVRGGADPSGFDCSGFVYYVYKSQGIKISRTQDQMYVKGMLVAKEDLQPGDIVFFENTYKAGISHCGIYVGDGKFIHSSTSGDIVKYSELDSAYYAARYYGAVRYY